MSRSSLLCLCLHLLLLLPPLPADALNGNESIMVTNHQSPKLLFDARDLERVRLGINNSNYLSELWAYVREQCNSIIGEEVKVFVPTLWNPELSKYRSWAVKLGIGYAISGDERYAKKAADILRAMFKIQNTYGRIDPETIHIGYATHTFLLAYDSIQGSGVLDEGDIKQAREFFEQLGYQLRDAIFRHRGNWAMCEAVGLVQIALYFPEIAESGEWLNAGKRRMEELMLIDFADDGGELELAPGYVQLCCYMVGIFAEVMRRFKGIDYYSMKFGQKTIQDMFRWLFYIMTPGGLMPAIHDSGRDVWQIGIFELGAARYHDGVLKFAARKAFDWTKRTKELGLGSYMPGGLEYALIWADETVQPVLPSEKTVLLPTSGFAVFRTGWDLNAHYLIYKYGPYGLGHQHYDKHSVEIWAYGSPLVLDAGTLSYSDPRHQTWDLQTVSHNTVMVDFVSQKPCDGLLNFFEDFPTFSAVSASAETYPGVMHTRTIIFDKLLSYYIFVDELQSDREHMYTWLWHVRGYTEFPIKAPEVSWKTPEGVGISLIFSSPEQVDVEIGSGPASGFGQIPYISFQTKGRSLSFIVLVIPYVNVKPQANISSSLSESGLTVKVEMGNRTLIYSIPYVGKNAVKIQELETEAELAFIEKIGVLTSRFGVIGASSLRVHNLTLLRSDPKVSAEFLIGDSVLTASIKAHDLTTLYMYTGLRPLAVLVNNSAAEAVFEQGCLMMVLRRGLNKILIACSGPISIRLELFIKTKIVQFILPSLAKYLVKYSPVLLIIIFVMVGLSYPLLHSRHLIRLSPEKRRERLLNELERAESSYRAGEIPHFTYCRIKEKIGRELSEVSRMSKASLLTSLTKNLQDLEERYRSGDISYQVYLLRKRLLEDQRTRLVQ